MLDLSVAERNKLKSAAILGLSVLCSSVKACLLSTCTSSGLQSQSSGEGELGITQSHSLAAPVTEGCLVESWTSNSIYESQEPSTYTCICTFRGFFPWMKPWHSRVEIWWSSLLNQKCNWKGKTFSLDHMVTTLNQEDRSMHSKFILSPIQTFLSNLHYLSGPSWAQTGVSVHLSNPDIEDGKRFKDPFLGVGTGTSRDAFLGI